MKKSFYNILLIGFILIGFLGCNKRTVVNDSNFSSELIGSWIYMARVEGEFLADSSDISTGEGFFTALSKSIITFNEDLSFQIENSVVLEDYTQYVDNPTVSKDEVESRLNQNILLSGNYACNKKQISFAYDGDFKNEIVNYKLEENKLSLIEKKNAETIYYKQN